MKRKRNRDDRLSSIRFAIRKDEDYVKIADNYEIKPTTNISDAYKSGDTSKLTDKEKETLDMAKKAIKDMKI